MKRSERKSPGERVNGDLPTEEFSLNRKDLR